MEYLVESPMGTLLLGFSGSTLTSLRIAVEEDVQPYSERSANTKEEEVIAWLKAYFAGENPPTANLDFKAKGTAFQERVWKALQSIPYGYCMTYSFLAGLLAPGKRPGRLLARAVGNALAHNPIWIIIPCHRVIRANGELGNYAGGVEMKKALLKLEGAELPDYLLK